MYRLDDVPVSVFIKKPRPFDLAETIGADNHTLRRAVAGRYEVAEIGTLLYRAGETVGRRNGKRMLKKTNWYLMSAPNQKLIPQAEEDIQKAEWMSKDEIFSVVFKNTYASVESLLRKNLLKS